MRFRRDSGHYRIITFVMFEENTRARIVRFSKLLGTIVVVAYIAASATYLFYPGFLHDDQGPVREQVQEQQEAGSPAKETGSCDGQLLAEFNASSNLDAVSGKLFTKEGHIVIGGMIASCAELMDLEKRQFVSSVGMKYVDEYLKSKDAVYYLASADSYFFDSTGRVAYLKPITRDVKHFRILGREFSTDGSGIYYRDNLIPGADVSTFVVRDPEDRSSECRGPDEPFRPTISVAYDKNHRYFIVVGKVMNEVDAGCK